MAVNPSPEHSLSRYRNLHAARWRSRGPLPTGRSAFPFGENVNVQVSVKPVPGETNTGNNSAEYPVVFSLEPS